MTGKKFLLVLMGLAGINTNIQAEEWGRVRCLRECTDRSCSDPAKRETCQNNCAHHPDTLEDCTTSKLATPSQQAPRRDRNSLILPVPPKPVEPAETITGTQAPERPIRPAPPKQNQAESIYTAAEVNTLLKGLLSDQIREVTTGCKSAIGKIEGGLGMVSPDNTKVKIVKEGGVTTIIDLIETGQGFIQIFKREQEEAENWVTSFNVNKNLSKDEWRKYKIDQIDVREKLSLENLKKIYQKSQEKSLLVAQDCKVKSAQFQGWLEAYLAEKQSHEETANKKKKFPGWDTNKK